MSAYYNEIDPYAAQWLRNLIDAGRIAPGVVDERSITDVQPDDLTGFTQCHFFAGIGGWSHALRLAGWPDDRPVWTGSCPCQPFSVAGRGAGVDDERHLWPTWQRLIAQCRPEIVFGEQVDAAVRHGWLDLVQSDLEAQGYAFAPVGLPAACVGAPHIRQRLWFVANADNERRPGQHALLRTEATGRHAVEMLEAAGRGEPGSLANSVGQGLERHARDGDDSSEPGRLGAQPAGSTGTGGGTGPLADPSGSGVRAQESAGAAGAPGPDGPGAGAGCTPAGDIAPAGGPLDGFWATADWIFCRDGKWRPVEPGTQPLAYGVPARVGRLRAYGNAIVPQVAAALIQETTHWLDTVVAPVQLDLVDWIESRVEA